MALSDMTLCILDNNDDIIFNKKITSLPLREEAIISDSIEFFDDPEPCMIHRSAVMKRIYIKLTDFFSSNLYIVNHKLSWEEMPDYLKNYLDIKNVKLFILRGVVNEK